jgi:formyl-CoA transferase
VSRPLEGVRVIDAGTRIAAPFCAGLLGELGAEVIKVEQPSGGDFMRAIGPFVPPEADQGGPGYSLFWAVEGRGRKSVTCDLRKPEGQALFKRLTDSAQVLVENFRPGAMEGWNLGPSNLGDHLVYVRISAFGQDGPYSQRPGLDRMGMAYGGLMHLNGFPENPPVRLGVTLTDYLTGSLAASAASAALYAGRGAVIDACLYGSALRILEWTLAAYDALGTVRVREGNRLANSAPLDNYPTADGKFVCIVAGADANFAKLCAAMGRPELVDEPRYKTLADRAANGTELNDLVAAWTMSMSAAEVEAACIAGDVPVATVYSATEIFADPHMAARGDIVTVDDPVVGPLRQQAPTPRIVGEPPVVPGGAPRLGEHNREIWCDLVGLTPAEFDQHVADGVV